MYLVYKIKIMEVTRLYLDEQKVFGIVLVYLCKNVCWSWNIKELYNIGNGTFIKTIGFKTF